MENLRYFFPTPLLSGFSPSGTLFPPELLRIDIMIFTFHFHCFSSRLPDLIHQNEILVASILLEFFQAAPEEEVPEISEESLFS